MRNDGKRLRTPWRPATFLLLIFCSLNFWTCRPEPELTPVLIGEAKIVGKVADGQLRWEPLENQLQSAYVVTPAFVKVCLGLALENTELKAEIKKLQAREDR